MVRIHPGQFCFAFALAAVARTAAPLAAGSPPPPLFQEDTAAVQAVARARTAQAGFEARRTRWLPVEMTAPSGGSCDEILGRMCLRLSEIGDWWPEADPTELAAARDDLLAVLAEAARSAPLDPWVVGQRVGYLAEAGRWAEALSEARSCRAPQPGWCAALEGYVLHGAGRYVEAEAAFRRSLDAMPPAQARAWLDPEPLLDDRGRRLLREAREEGPGAEDAFLARLWALADPLLLAPGNDRFTEHLARRVVQDLRQDARNPFGLAWGADLAELVLRYGAEVGWQRTFPRLGETGPGRQVMGQHHPYSRRYVPPGRVLEHPAMSGPGAWSPWGSDHPRSGYAPAYAPVILPPPAQIAVFPRGDSVLVVVSVDLPADTTWHGSHDHEPLPIPEPYRWGPEMEGLFLMPLDGGPVRSVQRPAGASGGMVLAAPAGEYVLSLERWSPTAARAGRLRRGVASPARPPDVPTLSELVVAGPRAPEGPLEALLPFVEPLSTVRPGDTLRIAWEVGGLGWRREEVGVELGLERESGGLLRAAGRVLGLVGDPPDVRLEWSEAGPEGPGPWLRSVLLALPPDLPEGRYELRLRILLAGREPLATRRELVVGS